MSKKMQKGKCKMQKAKCRKQSFAGSSNGREQKSCILHFFLPAQTLHAPRPCALKAQWTRHFSFCNLHIISICFFPEASGRVKILNRSYRRFQLYPHILAVRQDMRIQKPQTGSGGYQEREMGRIQDRNRAWLPYRKQRGINPLRKYPTQGEYPVRSCRSKR